MSCIAQSNLTGSDAFIYCLTNGNDPFFIVLAVIPLGCILFAILLAISINGDKK